MFGERALEDRAVRRADRGAHAIRHLRVGQAAKRMDFVHDDLYRHLARYLARGVPPHAVRDDKDSPIGNHAKTVFIPRPDNADVGAACGSDVHVISR